MPILEVENLSISFQQYTAGLQQKSVQVISSLYVALEAGEILAVVGQVVPERVYWHMPFSAYFQTMPI